MAHDHAHAPGHGDTPKDFGMAFAVGIGLNLAFVAAEAVYGMLANSLALLADAGHNLSDVLGLALAWGATVLVKRLPTRRRTYGLRRSSIMASLINAVLLLVAVAVIAWEAIVRFQHPQPIASGIVMAVAGVGVVINGITAWLFASGSRADVNIRGAFLHMAADAAVSVGVVLAALAMRATGWLWLDPTVSLLIVVVITIGTWGLLRQSLDLVMDAVPGHIHPDEVERYFEGLPGVVAVHDLHIWGMSTTETALTCHLVMPGGHPGDAALAALTHDLEHEFGIRHATIQIEIGDSAEACALTPEHLV